MVANFKLFEIRVLFDNILDIT